MIHQTTTILQAILRWVWQCTLVFVAGSLLLVVVYRFILPPVTPLMMIRMIEGILEGKPVGIQYAPVRIEDVSPYFLRAVIAAEDGRFLTHTGIDWDAVEEARRRNERAKARAEARRKRGKAANQRLYGASTISMQTAKNTFLPHGRTYIRKAFEAYFTYLIEFIWGKRRILEVYANIVELGSGIYGVEAAAQMYFRKSARQLTQYEAALLAAILPDPRRRNPERPTAYLLRRAATIQARMVGVALPAQ